MAQSELALGSSAFPISSFPGFPGTATRTFKGDILPGILYSFSELLASMGRADTLLIQHVSGGQVRIGGGAPGTPNLLQDFEPPMTALAVAESPGVPGVLPPPPFPVDGFLMGQMGWTPSFASNTNHARMMQVIQTTWPGKTSTQSVLVIGDGTQTNVRAKHELLPTIPSNTAYSGAASFYIPILAVINEPSFTLNIGPTNGSLVPSLAEISIIAYDNGSLVVYDNAGATVVGGVGFLSQGVLYDFRWAVNAANVWTLYSQGVLIYTGTVVNPLSRAFLSVDCNTGSGRAADVISVYFDDISIVQNTLSTTGLLIPTGTGQELRSGIQWINLKQCFISVNDGDVTAQVEILAIGG